MEQRPAADPAQRRLPSLTPAQERVGNAVIRILSALNVSVELAGERREMRAKRASAAEKAALWPRLVAMYRDFDDYQARTDREIPVVILSPV